MRIDLVVIGPASKRLGSRLVDESDLEPVAVESRSFPDGESYIRIDGEVEGKRAVVVQSTSPPQDKHLIQLLLTVDALKDLGAEKVFAAVPYLAYARQDSRFKAGEAVSVNTVIKLIEASGIDGFITFNVHKEESMKSFHVPALNLSAMPAIGEHAKKLDLRNLLVAAPDRGAECLAKQAAERLEAEHTCFEKHRDRETGKVETAYKRLDLRGRDVLIVDDIISTGSTIANVARIVKGEGAGRIIVGCAHALLAGNAAEKMRSAGVDLILGTDSVESEMSRVTVAPTLLDGLRRIA